METEEIYLEEPIIEDDGTLVGYQLTMRFLEGEQT